MPYRINPKNPREVQIYRGGRWKRKGVSANPEEAKKYLAKLKQVEKEEKG